MQNIDVWVYESRTKPPPPDNNLPGQEPPGDTTMHDHITLTLTRMRIRGFCPGEGCPACMTIYVLDLMRDGIRSVLIPISLQGLHRAGIL